MFEAALLAAVPALTNIKGAEAWAHGMLDDLPELYRSGSLVDSLTFVNASDVPVCDSSQMARFINGALLADWACYDAPADRVELSRLQTMIETFPQGFRLWVCRFEGFGYLPVAYTGWYPIDASVFAKAYDHPHMITHRREFSPLVRLSDTGSYVWLFYCSIVAQLRHPEHSRRMLMSYAQDLAKINILGLATAVSSPDSQSVAARFGMTYRGDMTHDGVNAMVYAMRAV